MYSETNAQYQDNQIGGNGGTGYTGGPDNKECKISYITNPEMDGLIKSLTETQFNMLVSATGGTGGEGEYTVIQLIEKVDNNIYKLDEEQTRRELYSHHKAYGPVIKEAEISIATLSIIRGKYLNHLKELVNKREPKSWMRYIKERITFLKERTIEKDMRVAKIPNALKYSYLGVDRLEKLAAIIKMEKIVSKDPIGEILIGLSIDVHRDDDAEELRQKIEAVLAQKRLEKNEIKSNFKDVRNLYESGYSINSQDIDQLAMIKEDVSKIKGYFEGIIANSGDRKALLGTVNEAPNKIRVAYLNKQLQGLISSVEKVINSPEIEGEIEVSRIDALMDKLKSLKAKLNKQ